MSNYADLFVKCNKPDGAKIIEDLSKLPYGTAGLVSWNIAQKETTEAVAMLGEPCLYYFYYHKGEHAPYALLAFNYSAGEYSLRDGRLYVANVVPSRNETLGAAEYESIVKQFHDDVLFPFLSACWPALGVSFPAVKSIPASNQIQMPGQFGQYVSFKIGISQGGNIVSHSCDPDGLANFFGKNPGAPLFVTPVHFDVAVLDKYRNMPNQYDVEEGCLRGYCNGTVEWCIPIDNHGINGVTVFLGDLGHLPVAEQHHFASHNVIKGQMSVAFEKSQLSAEFCNSTHPISLFNLAYHRLYDAFVDLHGWELILPLGEADQHYLKSLKLLTHDDQKEFDEQVLALAKILVDSLNVERLKSYNAHVRDDGSINLLEAVAVAQGIKGVDAHIAFLRNLQSLRSASSAHRKGDKYDKLEQKIGLNIKSKTEVFADFIEAATRFCQFMAANVNGF